MVWNVLSHNNKSSVIYQGYANKYREKYLGHSRSAPNFKYLYSLKITIYIVQYHLIFFMYKYINISRIVFLFRLYKNIYLISIIYNRYCYKSKIVV